MTSNRTTSYCLSNYIASGEKVLKKSKRVCSLHLEFHSPSFWPNKRNYRRRESLLLSLRGLRIVLTLSIPVYTNTPAAFFLIVVNPPIDRTDRMTTERTDLPNWRGCIILTESSRRRCGHAAADPSRISSSSFVGWIRRRYHPRDPHQRWQPSCFPGLGNLV